MAIELVVGLNFDLGAIKTKALVQKINIIVNLILFFF